MEFLQVVEQRRAVREYQDTVVEVAVIERLIGIAALAPSAMNLQPWAFAVITGAERIDEYARRAKEYLLSHAAALDSHARKLRPAMARPSGSKSRVCLAAALPRRGAHRARVSARLAAVAWARISRDSLDSLGSAA